MRGLTTEHALIFTASHRLDLNSAFVHYFYILNLIEKSDIIMDNSQNTLVQVRT